MKTTVAVTMFAVILLSHASSFAQMCPPPMCPPPGGCGGGQPTQAELTSLGNAAGAYMQQRAAEIAATTDDNQAKFIAGNLPAPYLKWDATTTAQYQKIISNGETALQLGWEFYAKAGGYYIKGNNNYTTANALWQQGNYALAATTYDIATEYWRGPAGLDANGTAGDATDQYDEADFWFEMAIGFFEQAEAFYSNNTPPLI
jgi:hypothetical protein